MILDDLFSAASDFDTDRLAALMHPEVRFTELPNRINPTGGERGYDEALAGFRKGRELLSAQSYDVLSTVSDGDTIASRTLWRGTLAASGQELTAHIATFTQVRDGRIFRHATYDCYEPLAAPITAP
jgi:ketosteroid isomerase-like protein